MRVTIMEYVVLGIKRARSVRKLWRAEAGNSLDDLLLRAANLIRALCGEDIGGGRGCAAAAFGFRSPSVALQ